MSGSDDCANICGARAGGACLHRVVPQHCLRYNEGLRAIVCSTPAAPHPIYTPDAAPPHAVENFESGGVLGVPTGEVEATAEKWRALGWQVTKTDGPVDGVTLLHITPAAEPSASDAILDSIRDVLGLRPGQDTLAAVTVLKIRREAVEDAQAERDTAVADAERYRSEARHRGRLCGLLLDEIGSLGYMVDRIVEVSLYTEALKAAGREVKS